MFCRCCCFSLLSPLLCTGAVKLNILNQEEEELTQEEEGLNMAGEGQKEEDEELNEEGKE